MLMTQKKNVISITITINFLEIITQSQRNETPAILSIVNFTIDKINFLSKSI